MKIPVSPPASQDLLARLYKDPARLDGVARLVRSGIGPAPAGKYRHWDVLRHLSPPEGWSHEEWWLAIKLARQQRYVELPLRDGTGDPFRLGLPDAAHRMTHRIDSDARGAIGGSAAVTNPQTRNTYLLRSLLEEAITSSQLEGASTTREAAKAMIREGRAPRDRGEHMIFNNYEAMQFVRKLRNEPLTPEKVFALQSMLTCDTLDDPSAAGRFRRADEDICVMDETGNVLHRPPDADELPQRLRALCEFANAPDGAEPFVHPVIRSILLHFWLAYDHPFVDGNGRTARALFYWSMASRGYWLAEYISISRILKQAPGKYARAFLYTETDDNDVTYFVLNQLRVVLRAIEDLHAYLERKQAEIRATEALLRRSRALRNQLNSRQLGLLSHALEHPDAEYRIEGHRNAHGVTYPTARSDLLGLAATGLLEQLKVGRSFAFRVPPDLHDRLSKLG
jgi:Fic family protein